VIALVLAETIVAVRAGKTVAVRAGRTVAVQAGRTVAVRARGQEPALWCSDPPAQIPAWQ
jgi:uncharacterized protein (DUF2345 family)